MKRRNDANLLTTALSRFLNLPAVLIDKLAWRCCKINRYELRGDTIVFQRSLLTVQMIHSADIERWSVQPEMGFDVVRIELRNGDALTWIDKYNDLLTSLRIVAQSREVPKRNAMTPP